MDEHWIHYAELMQPAIDSNEDDETASKERFNLVGLDNSFSDKPQGHMMQMYNCVKTVVEAETPVLWPPHAKSWTRLSDWTERIYKLLNDLWYLCQIAKASSVKSAADIRAVLKWFSWDSAGLQAFFYQDKWDKWDSQFTFQQVSIVKWIWLKFHCHSHNISTSVTSGMDITFKSSQ